MADYNLHGLNPRDFQHFVQAIARKHIAAGVMAFGDGKDGARDLTYRGKMDYPSAAGAWDGYLVMGCKFYQRPTGDSQKDGTWALKQLEGDLKKFASKRRKLPKPDYFLFVTNVRLSGVAEAGGRDRASNMLQEYSRKLSLKGYSIWNYNDLRTFLDGDADLRAAYGHFITAGDILAQMMELMKPQRVDFADVMHVFLQKELIADMSAKLQSAGEDPELQIPLANVFVDLPFSESAEAAVLASEEQEAKLPKVVHALLNAGSSVLRRTTHDDGNERERRLPGAKESRFVIVGGPGQGKSTFGQYLCQLYRASILRDRPAERLDDRVFGILKQLDKQQKNGGLPLTRRFPIRIELRNFAHALATKPQITLLEYMRLDIARLGSATVSVEDLRSWLGQYPWILVLDGLDEVPASSNRSEVLREIDCLRVDAASRNSDMLIVATTRPQSYSKEFSEELFRHLYLTPLSSNQALHYGRRLAEARCGADERRRDELIRSLEKACKNEATSRLMQSPLQVTIMATLLEDTGEPPQQRYRLFAEYYRTIYKRETRRKLLGGILTERQKDIDTIHAHAGLMLQVAGEKTTGKRTRSSTDDIDSALSDDQFRELVRRRLEQIGISATKVLELLDSMSDGSLQRLVFLVRPRVGWVQFDITSLKEFMAAEAIMNGSDDDVRERLKVIAPASYWRNVFQFAVGKCFVEREYLLDNLVSLCTGLNEDKACEEIVADETVGRAGKAVLWGSRLALDILSDGTARQYPGYELRFARIGLQLIRLADLECSARLAAVFHDELKELYVEVIDDRLGQANLWCQIGAWHLLINLADREVSWAIELLEARWPVDVEAQRAILFSRGLRFPSEWVLRKASELAPKLEPHWFFHYADYWYFKDLPVAGPLGTMLHSLRGRAKHFEIPSRSAWSELIARLSLTPCHLGNELWEELKVIDIQNKQWLPFVSGARFGANPSAKSLAAELKWLGDNWEPCDKAWLTSLPWPIAACLNRAKSREDLLGLTRLAKEGSLGDIKHWNAAEQRWREVGVLDEDFQAMSDDKLPLRPEYSVAGFPFGVCGYATSGEYSSAQLSSTLDKLRRMDNTETRSWLASAVLRPWEYRRGRKSVPLPGQFRELYAMASRRPRVRWQTYWLDNLAVSPPGGSLNAEWVDFLDWLGREEEQFWVDIPRTELAEELIHHFCSNPDGRRGLLPIIAGFAAAGCRCTLPKHVLDLAKSWSPRAKDDAIGLGLAGGDVNVVEIIALAHEISKSDALDTAVWRALHMASASSLKQAANFALALLPVLADSSEREADAAGHARRILTEFMTNRPSQLQNPSVWQGLHLPERL